MKFATLLLLGMASLVQGKTCSEAEQDNQMNPERVIECSSNETCYDQLNNLYKNALCTDSNESCGKWKVGTTKVVEGCILTKYCDIKGTYLGSDVTYECPDGKKGDGGGGAKPGDGDGRVRESKFASLDDIAYTE